MFTPLVVLSNLSTAAKILAAMYMIGCSERANTQTFSLSFRDPERDSNFVNGRPESDYFQRTSGKDLK